MCQNVPIQSDYDPWEVIETVYGPFMTIESLSLPLEWETIFNETIF